MWFDEPVRGVNATDLMANGITAKALSGLGAGPYIFEFDELAAGQIELTWANEHGITDFNKTPNEFDGQPWSTQIDPKFSYGDLVITELSAASTKAYKRVEGDWVEIHNRGNTTVNLDRWSLTDDKDDLAKWIFPSIDISP